jgi:large subunit ribosomal protein L15
MKLNQIRDNQGATTARKRVGRGIGSGLGKTAGHGHKGQKARTGVALNGFEGGQIPLYRRLPKRGFNNFNFRKNIAGINLGQLQEAIDSGKLDPKKAITMQTLLEASLIRKNMDGVKLLGHGSLKTPIEIEVTLASKSALAAAEKVNAKVKVLAAK